MCAYWVCLLHSKVVVLITKMIIIIIIIIITFLLFFCILLIFLTPLGIYMPRFKILIIFIIMSAMHAVKRPWC